MNLTLELEDLYAEGLTFEDCVKFFAEKRTVEEENFAALAIEKYEVEGEVEIDENAIVSLSENEPRKGAYVMAWLWVERE